MRRLRWGESTAPVSSAALQHRLRFGFEGSRSHLTVPGSTNPAPRTFTDLQHVTAAPAHVPSVAMQLARQVTPTLRCNLHGRSEGDDMHGKTDHVASAVSKLSQIAERGLQLSREAGSEERVAGQLVELQNPSAAVGKPQLLANISPEPRPGWANRLTANWT